jgi:hypothetical protein
MVAGAQGYYISAPDASVFGRVMNLDLEQRYAGIDGAATDHVCTGNTAYRAAALVEIGGFDESLGYGYDNDVSYRLIAAGYRLVIDRNARAVHRWREGLIGYLIQQYGFGYGRIDLIAKHPRRAGGDAVSPIRMIAHPLLMTAAAICALVAIGCRLVGWPWQPFAIAAAALVAALAAERCVAGIAALRQFGDPIALAFPPVHLARDQAWVTAIVVWVCRRIFRRPGRPAHSMRGRLAYRLRRRDSEPAP